MTGCPNQEEMSQYHARIIPCVLELLNKADISSGSRVLDFGCGDARVASAIAKSGFDVKGFDIDRGSVEKALQRYPDLDLRLLDCDEEIPSGLGEFDAIVCLDVIEHCIDPVGTVNHIYDLLKPRGICILSTPYHGYIKNLTISLLNGWDKHLDPFWKEGHIRFWSESSLRRLFQKANMRIYEVKREGRVPVLAKSLVVCAQKETYQK